MAADVAAKAVSTHSRPKAAGHGTLEAIAWKLVSTHSRPKAAGHLIYLALISYRCFNSQPPEGGW